jgi:hypothetical protein
MCDDDDDDDVVLTWLARTNVFFFWADFAKFQPEKYDFDLYK